MDWDITRIIDLATGHPEPRFLPNVLMEVGDTKSHRWQVTVLENGQPVDLTGATIVGYFVRSDGYTVPVTGSVSGNVATVLTLQSCTAVKGELCCVMKATLGEITLTLDACVVYVRGDITDAIVDPGHVVPSLQELLAMIDDCEAAAAEARAAAAASYTVAVSGTGIIFTQPAT